ncbi:uncharacterized protein UTRI_05298 [Ustilago trichophora]|uniref:DUF202 domain-containing protein n=1 Tax=Ustilago trichophora TaxID=86804 RepID=A0A5C3EMF1_9BASI|nr:uncharacterized protein UTRI_05298 [Ustilago trichophora]
MISSAGSPSSTLIFAQSTFQLVRRQLLIMPAAFSSQGGSGLNGLNRINTGLSEASGHAPRSSGSGRLSLHIPNTYPRNFSPRSPSSGNATTTSSRPVSPSGVDFERPSQESVSGALKGAQEQSTIEQSEPSGSHIARSRSSSRIPRVRVFRRDSSLITIHQLDNDDDAVPVLASRHQRTDLPSEGVAEVHLRPITVSGRLLQPLQRITSFFSTKQTSSSSARDFLARERNFFVWLRLSCLLAILSASLILQLQLPDTARSSSDHQRHPRKRRRTDDAPVDWNDLPISSKAFAGIFFALSILALGTGLADYLSAERQLEKEQVDFDETEGVFLNDGHTSRFVHGVMLVVGAGIVASALWLIAY